MTHSPRAGTLYTPQWMNMPNLAFLNHSRDAEFALEASGESRSAGGVLLAAGSAVATRAGKRAKAKAASLFTVHSPRAVQVRRLFPSGSIFRRASPRAGRAGNPTSALPTPGHPDPAHRMPPSTQAKSRPGHR